ncbi:gamma-type small acid-soluble spore protein [Metabacillus niabensis]|uniref:Small, acid-soluble spore protein gamma-type n=1 Tax=Metabacillus niabensis TaxID=324854 RepID=A0ABT9ZA88_9BACI|nr:gamma-type small acid-soluble spore protein [Metabacillus niabensis]MDQ0228543.1 small acid-soluble spore protein E (minor gamma-type SASP) [Metabacillus niabensis]PAD69843.1 gamma-type small acid-soluble spore protein [Bacillus sp. 7586-K]
MAQNNRGKTTSGTNIQEVRQQNAQSAQGQGATSGQFGTEFASETNVQDVKKRNQQAEQNKGQNS